MLHVVWYRFVSNRNSAHCWPASSEKVSDIATSASASTEHSYAPQEPKDLRRRTDRQDTPRRKTHALNQLWCDTGRSEDTHIEVCSQQHLALAREETSQQEASLHSSTRTFASWENSEAHGLSIALKICTWRVDTPSRHLNLLLQAACFQKMEDDQSQEKWELKPIKLPTDRTIPYCFEWGTSQKEEKHKQLLHSNAKTKGFDNSGT